MASEFEPTPIFESAGEITSPYFTALKNKLSKLLPTYNYYFNSLSVEKFSATNKQLTKLELSHNTANSKTLISTCSSAHLNLDHLSIDFAQQAFLDLVATKLEYQHLAEHFFELLSGVYRDTRITKCVDHIVINYSEAKFDQASSIFAATLNENSIIFLPDNAEPSEFSYKSSRIGKVMYVCKNSTLAFNKGNLMGMLKLEPAFSHSTFIYSKSLKIKNKKVFAIIDELRSGEATTPYTLKKNLVDLPLSTGGAFETLSIEILNFIFASEYEDFKLMEQTPNYTSVRRRDFIIDNRAPRHRFLNDLLKRGCKYILFDAKNYADELSVSHLDTFYSYIQEQKYFGRFGIILSRKGAKKNAHQHIYHRMLSKHEEIIILDENDILQLIDLRATGRDPLSYIEDKLRALQLQA
ncbi:MAG: hypothetical protein A2W79_05725 [Pseudomonadales bacterium RIFCSPLOWO2_12_60_38]|nr:MAG: hypothetical protein A2W79_05725 [Pseudomonadales bacterium RIFCSPLOWO2_12_60_38]OHC38450.1 MAG: hypothetical protein A3G72_02530 [Pseudomonadales bacterium RIFCSPLOWO2_12_FULL_59_450]